MNTLEINSLREAYQNILTLEQNLCGVVSTKLLNQISETKEKILVVLNPIFEQEERDWEKNQQELDEISSEHKLFSVWSITEVPAKDMNKKTPEIKELIYESWGETQHEKFDTPTSFTWLEFWKIADKMIKNSQDTHHIFIESLKEDTQNKGIFRIYTGS